MPFIGNQPALSFTSFAKQDFTTSATTSYTLDNPVANANELALFINFVRQEPTTAYSANSTTLTLTEATSVGDDMYCVYLGKAVQTVNPPNASVGASQLVDGSVTSAKMFSGFANGITMADQWRLTAELTGTQSVISTNLERVNNASWGGIGTGMTESSGIFSFPSTGTYLVIFNANFKRGYSDAIVNFFIEATTNNSSYENVAGAFNNASAISNGFNNVETKTLINVTDISNVKVRFEFSSATSGSNNHVLHGNTGYTSTSFTFIRLGDST